MSLLRNITSGLRSLFRRDQVDRELNEELRAYLEMEAAEKMKQGMSRKGCPSRRPVGTGKLGRFEGSGPRRRLGILCGDVLARLAIRLPPTPKERRINHRLRPYARDWHWRNDSNLRCRRFSPVATSSLSNFPSDRQDLEHVLPQGTDGTRCVGAGIP